MPFWDENRHWMITKLMENCMCSVKMETWISNIKKAASLKNSQPFKSTNLSLASVASTAWCRHSLRYRDGCIAVADCASDAASAQATKFVWNTHADNRASGIAVCYVAKCVEPAQFAEIVRTLHALTLRLGPPEPFFSVANSRNLGPIPVVYINGVCS